MSPWLPRWPAGYRLAQDGRTRCTSVGADATRITGRGRSRSASRWPAPRPRRNPRRAEPAAAPAAKPAAPAPQAAAAPAASPGKQALDDLVKRANEEGEVTVTVLGSWDQSLIPPLAEAFKKRFGLTGNVQIATMAAAQHYPIAIAETRAGTPPTYDAVQGDPTETAQLIGAGGIQPIDNWELLLAEINPLVQAVR